MSSCLTCNRALEPKWICCPHCGRRVATFEPPYGMRGSYGSGVRAQVFDVVVRQALAGADWREICSGPMALNGIVPKEIELEVRRRQDLLRDGGDDKEGGDNRRGSGVPKKPLPDSGETGNSLPLPPPS